MQFFLIWTLLLTCQLMVYSSVKAQQRSGDVQYVKNDQNTTLLAYKEEIPTSSNIETGSCQPNFEFVSPFNGEPRCCLRCPPGKGMRLLCTEKNETECQPCKPGYDFSSRDSAQEKCMDCTLCNKLHPNADVHSACTVTSDTQCKCTKGLYFTESTCKNCSKCPPDQQVIKPCDGISDTKCLACKKGFFFDLNGEVPICKQCSACPLESQVEAQPCTTNTDTICCPKAYKDCHLKQKNPSKTTNSTTPKITNAPNDWRRLVNGQNYETNQSESEIIHQEMKPIGNELIPLYVTIMSLVIVSLILYVIYKRYCNRHSSNDHKLSPKEVGQPLIRVMSPDQLLQSNGTRKQRQPYLPEEDNRLMCQLGDKQIHQIEISLATNRNGVGWDKVAHEIGYAQGEIQAFQSAFSEVPSPAQEITAVHTMFLDWFSRDTATVASLARALHKVGREDVIQILRMVGAHHPSRKHQRTADTEPSFIPPTLDADTTTQMGQV